MRAEWLEECRAVVGGVGGSGSGSGGQWLGDSRERFEDWGAVVGGVGGSGWKTGRGWFDDWLGVVKPPAGVV